MSGGSWRHHQEHVEWVGCSLHDLIQPSFSFLVGVALPFSLAGRLAGAVEAGDDGARVLAGLRAGRAGDLPPVDDTPQTNFTFEDTLTQIGLGYGFLFLLGSARRGSRSRWG